LSDLPITIFNPRRDNWDKSWKQDKSNPQFKAQIEWELDHLEKADIIPLFLQPDTTSPISLLELSLFAAHRKLVICYPEGFGRRGNVQIVCERYGITLVEIREKLVEEVRERLESIIVRGNKRTGDS
jgi:hypothetical protein